MAADLFIGSHEVNRQVKQYLVALSYVNKNKKQETEWDMKMEQETRLVDFEGKET
jgi:hypothetical protein